MFKVKFIFRLKQLIVNADCSKNDNDLVFSDCKKIVYLERSDITPKIEFVKCAKGRKKILEKIYYLKRSNRSYIYTTYLPKGCENGLPTKKYTVEDIKKMYIPKISARKTKNEKTIYK